MSTKKRLYYVAFTSLLAIVLIAATTTEVDYETDADSVIVALPDGFPIDLLPDPDARNVIGMILREPGKSDLIILHPESVSASSLAIIAGRLEVSRARLRAPQRAVLGVVVSTASRTSQRPPQAFQAVLDQLESRPTSDIGNIGQGRWIEVPASRLGL